MPPWSGTALSALESVAVESAAMTPADQHNELKASTMWMDRETGTRVSA
jgi:hypothetical protein